MRSFHVGGLLVTLFCTAWATATQQAATSPGSDWPSYNGTPEGTRSSTLTQITPANASGPERACTFDTGENMSMQSGPVVVNNMLYLTTDTSTYAIDAATCGEIWHTVRTYEPIGFLNNHGVAYMDGRLFRVPRRCDLPAAMRTFE